MVYHEVRYYWDDGRSGIPVNSSSLTTNDLVEPLPTGTGLGIKYSISENISQDIDDNTFADLTTVIDNITKVRYGFYQDAAPGSDAWEQVYVDNLGFYNETQGYARSTEISLPPDKIWKDLIITRTEPDPDTKIEVSILNGTTNETIPGFDSLLGTMIDISMINRLIYPNLRLQTILIGSGNATPILHDWMITWVNATPPETPTGFALSNPLNGYSLILSWNSNTELDMAYYRLEYSLDNMSFSWLTDVPAGTISFIHYGLTMGVTYYYKISAVDNEHSPSPKSESVEGTPDIDTDLDGIGNIPDLDDDNDGEPDVTDLFPLNPLNEIDIKIDDIQTRVIDIQNILAGLNLTDLENTIDLLNQSLTAQIDKLNNVLDNLTFANVDEMMNYLVGMNATLSQEMQDLLTQVTSDIADIMNSMNLLEANLTAQHIALNDTLDILRNLIQNEHTMTRSEILSGLNDSLALLKILDTNMTAHDTDIKNLINALDNLIQNENTQTRDQLIDNATEILNRLDLLDQDIVDEIEGMNNTIAAQLTATRNSIENQLKDLNSTIQQFYDDLDSDLGNILISLLEHDDETGENHTDIIATLEELLDSGDLRSLSLENLKSMLMTLAGNVSSYNQSLANDILGVVGDIDDFESDTQDRLDTINRTLNDLAKLEDILEDLALLNNELSAVEDNLQDSIEDKSKEEEIEDRIKWLEMLVLLIIILLIVNIIMTLVVGIRKKGSGGEMAGIENQSIQSPQNEYVSEKETNKTASIENTNAGYDFPPPPAPPENK
jgi:hypothetical protein